MQPLLLAATDIPLPRVSKRCKLAGAAVAKTADDGQLVKLQSIVGAVHVLLDPCSWQLSR